MYMQLYYIRSRVGGEVIRHVWGSTSSSFISVILNMLLVFLQWSNCQPSQTVFALGRGRKSVNTTKWYIYKDRKQKLVSVQSFPPVIVIHIRFQNIKGIIFGLMIPIMRKLSVWLSQNICWILLNLFLSVNRNILKFYLKMWCLTSQEEF